jgi:hypothetical protein
VDGTGARRLWALVNGLPADAATWRNGVLWTDSDYMLALVAELVDGWGAANARVHGVKQNSLPKPLEITRPQRSDDTED